MIGLLRGIVLQTDFRRVLLDVNGVGYNIQLPLIDLGRMVEGEEVVLFIHTHVREDALNLYGFLEEEALAVFELLISISGVGPRIGLAFLSGMVAAEIQNAIVESNVGRLTKIPGVGKKTAERIVLELKDKVEKQRPMGKAVTGESEMLWDDLSSALLNLGYKKNQVERAIEKTKSQDLTRPSLSELLKEALKNI